MPDTTAERRVVAVALARGATILVRDADLTTTEEAEIAGLLDHLVRQGVVACFSLQPPHEGSRGRQSVLNALRPHVGDDVLKATLAAGPPPPEPPPAFLCSVWPFVAGPCVMTATGQFLGLDLEVFARPAVDTDVGFHLAGVDEPLEFYAAPLP